MDLMIEHHGSQDRRSWGHDRRSHQPTIYLRIPPFTLPTIYLSFTKPLEPPSTQRHHNFISDHEGTSAPPYPARGVDFQKRNGGGLGVGEEWDVSGMVEGYAIDGPQAPSNAYSFF